jgi:DNA-binding CsgD family transcriptional regulator
MASTSPPATTDAGSPRGLELLSKREAEVLAVTAQGLTNRETAVRLGVSVHAVKFHLAAIYRKLHVANRTQAVAIFVSARPGLNGD